MREHDLPVAWTGGNPVVSAPCEIDITNAHHLGRTLRSCLVPGPVRIVVDMSGTTFCDMAGMHQLALAQECACAAGAEVQLETSDMTILRVMAITGLDQILPTFPTVHDALTAPWHAVTQPTASAGPDGLSATTGSRHDAA